jgi:hypothetical protein
MLEKNVVGYIAARMIVAQAGDDGATAAGACGYGPHRLSIGLT